ncbi:hypothetical protein A4A49_32192 [Nicotiana attenuata]|uniref:Uncharacterized protein n=1 Tax=Nicotiana attenuata TaxID=49451 RepID=A0A1J6KKY2_NICAT|nr:hypothetical protein A4A49_32192 [Nicotiana attenuata]
MSHNCCSTVLADEFDLEDGDSEEDKVPDGHHRRTVAKNYVSPTDAAIACHNDAETNTTNFLVPLTSEEDVVPKEITNAAEVTHPFENVIPLHIHRSPCLWNFFDKNFILANEVSDIESDVVGITYLPSKYSRSKARTKLELLELQLVATVEISTVSYSHDEIGLRVDRGSLEHQSGTSSFEDMYSLHLVMALGPGGELFDRTIARGYSLENDAVDNFGHLPILVLNCHFMVVMHKNLKSEKPSLWFNSTAYFPRDFVLFDIHIVFDGCWNQLLTGHPRILCPRHQLGLAQCLEEQFWLHQFSPDELGLDFPFDPGSAALIRVQSPQRRLEDHSTLSYPSRQYVFKLSEYLANDLLRLLKCIDYHGLSIHMVNKFVMPYSKGTQDLSHHDLGQNEVYYAVTIVVPGMSRAWYCALNSAQEEFAGACHPVNFTSIEVNITTASLPKPLISRILDPNLEDKVLMEEGSIVVNMDNSNNAYGPIIWTEASQVVGPRAKLRKGQGIRQPNKRFALDPG